MPTDGIEQIVHSTVMQPLQEAAVRHSTITRSDQLGLEPNEGCGESQVCPPLNVPTLLGIPVELQLQIVSRLPLPDLARMDRTCRHFHELAEPQLAQAKATHFGAMVRNADEVRAVIRFLMQGVPEYPGVPPSYPGLRQHLHGEPLVAIGYAICDMEDDNEREKSMALWISAVIGLPKGRPIFSTEVGRVIQGSKPYRPSLRQDNKAELARIGAQLRRERYPETEVQSALDALGVWMRMSELTPATTTATLVHLIAIVLFALTIGVSAATTAVSEARRPRAVLDRAPSHSTRDALAESTRNALARSARAVQTVQERSADPEFAPHAPLLLAALPSNERLARLDVSAPATQRALAILESHIEAASPLFQGPFGPSRLDLGEADLSSWQQLGRVAAVMLQLLLSSNV